MKKESSCPNLCPNLPGFCLNISRILAEYHPNFARGRYIGKMGGGGGGTVPLLLSHMPMSGVAHKTDEKLFYACLTSWRNDLKNC